MNNNYCKPLKRLYAIKDQLKSQKYSNTFEYNSTKLSFNKTSWSMKFIDNIDIPQKTKTLKNKTIFITGASRGIGLSIAIAAASQGANIAVVAKTATENKKLPGTIYTAVEEINKAGGKGLAIQCDIRSEESVKNAVEKCVHTFGGIDILINNASAISLTSTSNITMKTYDLMHSVNARGTFICSKYCLPYLIKSNNPHILTISPPLNNITNTKWFKDFPAYAMAKFGMSIYANAFSAEFKEYGIASNCLWPRTSVATAAVQNLLGGDETMKRSRKPEIMADSAIIILNSDAKCFSGNFLIDDEVLLSSGVTDLKKYNCIENINDNELMPDLFV